MVWQRQSRRQLIGAKQGLSEARSGSTGSEALLFTRQRLETDPGHAGVPLLDMGVRGGEPVPP